MAVLIIRANPTVGINVDTSSVAFTPFSSATLFNKMTAVLSPGCQWSVGSYALIRGHCLQTSLDSRRVANARGGPSCEKPCPVMSEAGDTPTLCVGLHLLLTWTT